MWSLILIVDPPLMVVEVALCEELLIYLHP